MDVYSDSPATKRFSNSSLYFKKGISTPQKICFFQSFQFLVIYLVISESSLANVDKLGYFRDHKIGLSEFYTIGLRDTGGKIEPCFDCYRASNAVASTI